MLKLKNNLVGENEIEKFKNDLQRYEVCIKNGDS